MDLISARPLNQEKKLSGPNYSQGTSEHVLTSVHAGAPAVENRKENLFVACGLSSNRNKREVLSPGARRLDRLGLVMQVQYRHRLPGSADAEAAEHPDDEAGNDAGNENNPYQNEDVYD